MVRFIDLGLTFPGWSAILSLAGDRTHSVCLMTHPHFLLGLCFGAALSVSAFIYGTSGFYGVYRSSSNRSSPRNWRIYRPLSSILGLRPLSHLLAQQTSID